MAWALRMAHACGEAVELAVGLELLGGAFTAETPPRVHARAIVVGVMAMFLLVYLVQVVL